MAILIVVAVRDRAVDAFMRPFMSPTPGAAVRAFRDEVNRADANNPLYQHPEDHDLYQLATFDEATGKYSNNEPKQLAIGNTFKEKA